jgi:hypothetical protein
MARVEYLDQGVGRSGEAVGSAVLDLDVAFAQRLDHRVGSDAQRGVGGGVSPRVKVVQVDGAAAGADSGSDQHEEQR